jgi:anti-sigma factor RsiW
MNCAWVEEHDLVALYLSGKLPEAEAEGFESHYFGCERCWADVRQAGEVRAALGLPVLAMPSSERRASGRDAWTLLAAAAAVAIMVLGLRQLAQRPEAASPEPVWRGGSEAPLPLQVSIDPKGRISLEWPAQEAAQVYVAQIFTSDGVSVWKRETTETTVSLDVGDLPPNRPGISFLGKIEALDTMGQAVARSELKPLSRP